MNRTKHLTSAQAIAALSLAVASTLHAADYTGAAGSNFTLNTNWNTGVVPNQDAGAADPDANISNGSSSILNGNVSPRTLYLGRDGGTSGALTINGGTINVTGPSQFDGESIAVGLNGVGTLTMNAGTLNLGNLQAGDFDFQVGKNSVGSSFTLNGGTVHISESLRVARGQTSNASATASILGGEFDAGAGVVVGRGNGGSTPTGTFIIGGTGKFVAGNNQGENVAGGFQDEGYFSIANNAGAIGHVTVKDTGVVRALRLTGRLGTGDLTIQDNGQFKVVNSLGATLGGTQTLSNSFLGGGNNSNGDGPEGTTANYTLTLKNNGLLDINSDGTRDPNRTELQGFVLARGNSTANATIQDSAALTVHQRLIIGGRGEANLANALGGFDGTANPGNNPGGNSTVGITGGTITADQLIVGGTGTGILNASGGTVKTQAFGQTLDNGNPSTSVNSIRVGFSTGSTGTFNVSGNAVVTTGADLGIGQYGNGTLSVTGGNASILANDVYVQKFAGSTGKVIANISGQTLTTIRANNNVTINGGTLQVNGTSVPTTGAHLYNVLGADADNNGSGARTGTFGTVNLPLAPNVSDSFGRRWSNTYTAKQVQVGLARPGDTRFRSLVDNTDINQIISAGHYNDGTTTNAWAAGDFNGDGQVNNTDINAIISAGSYNNGSYDTGALIASGKDGSGGIIAKVSSAGVAGDGQPDYIYDPATGDVKFSRDGFDSTKKIQSLTLLSAGSKFITGVGYTTQNNSGLDIDETAKQYASRFSGFAIASNATQDLGNILPTNLSLATVQSDLSSYYLYQGGTAPNENGFTAGIIMAGVPEPTAAGLLLFGLGAIAARRRARKV